MRKNNKNPNVLLHDGHKKPVTRRDFLSAGLLSFCGYMVAPSVLQVLTADTAFAAGSAAGQCVNPTATRMPSFIAVNLSGGGALAGNYIPLGQPLDGSRELYTDYHVMGMGSAPPVESEFGGVKFVGGSGTRQASPFLRGIRDRASAATIGKTAFLGIAHQSQDDSNINKIDCSGLVTAAGLRGTLLPKLGRRETETGVNHDYALIRPPAPLVVNRIDDLKNALAPAGALATRLSNPQRLSLLKLISKLSGSQAAAIASPNSASGTTLANLVSCATGKNVELSSGSAVGIDPQLDTSVGVAGLWSMADGNTLFGQNQQTRQAMGAMIYNSLKGQAGAVGFDLGGYDYHGSGRPNQDTKDFEAGQIIGLILESAAALNQKVFIQVQSDGGISTNGTSLGDEFVSDHGVSGMAFCIAYDPAGRPRIKDDRFGYQVGYFTNKMGASADAPITGAEAAGIATFTNYMKFAGAMDVFETMLGRQYTAAELDYVCRFA